MSRRRTGAIAIGVGAATAVVLSLAGAKTPVVIGSAAALGIAGGVIAGRKGAGKRVSTTKQLVGEELLVKVKELGDVSKSDLLRACGYVSNKNDGGERLDFTALYEALLEAKGLNLGDMNKSLEDQAGLEYIKETNKDHLNAHDEPERLIQVTEEFYLPMGRYYIGDLSYIINEKNDWLENFYKPMLDYGEGVYSFKGKEFFIANIYTGDTGDGLYPCTDEEGVTDDVAIMVDCGNIGVIPIDLVEDQEQMESLLEKKASFILDVNDRLLIDKYSDGVYTHGLTLRWTWNKDNSPGDEYIDIPFSDEFCRQIYEIDTMDPDPEEDETNKQMVALDSEYKSWLSENIMKPLRREAIPGGIDIAKYWEDVRKQKLDEEDLTYYAIARCIERFHLGEISGNDIYMTVLKGYKLDSQVRVFKDIKRNHQHFFY